MRTDDVHAGSALGTLLQRVILKELVPARRGLILLRLLLLLLGDAEVLDRNAIMLGELPPALRYLNTRILQMHDVWHLVGGYTTDAMHEVAISAFQLAQFGHNYSSMFLAAAGRMAHEHNAAGFGIFFQTVAEAWLHGRENPSFMAIEWEELFGCWCEWG